MAPQSSVTARSLVSNDLRYRVVLVVSQIATSKCNCALIPIRKVLPQVASNCFRKMQLQNAIPKCSWILTEGIAPARRGKGVVPSFRAGFARLGVGTRTAEPPPSPTIHRLRRLQYVPSFDLEKIVRGAPVQGGKVITTLTLTAP